MNHRKSLLFLFLALFLAFSVKPARAFEEIKPNYIVVYGDTRSGNEIHRKIVNKIFEINPVAVFHTGDMLGTWENFNDITSELRKKIHFYSARGNHDDLEGFLNNFDLPNNERWYSVNIENIHFVVLDSEIRLFKFSQQYRWLVKDLSGVDSRQSKFIVLLFHFPIFSSETGHVEDQAHWRDNILPLIEQYGVNLVFSGHNHGYERLVVDHINYVVTGGGGASLSTLKEKSPDSRVFKEDYYFCTIAQYPDRLVVEVTDIFGNLIDRFTINASRDVPE